MTINRTTRDSATRKTAERAPTYVPPSVLDVPADLAEYYEKTGKKLRWIRIMRDGQEDYQNISKRLREGYTFLKYDDLEGAAKSYFTYADTKSLKNVIQNGDLALAIIDIELAKARQRHYETLALRKDAASRQLASGGTNRLMDQTMPVFDESKTRTTGGGTRPSVAFGSTTVPVDVIDVD